jgi:hypothetical protein
MNSGSDMPGSPGRDPDAALTPEERAMAERIARASPQREPPAALDASILAAARDAVAAPVAPAAPLPRERPRMRRRWPVAAGIAATLVLAVGIAWQLRPVDDTQVEYSEAPRAAVATPTPGPGGPRANDESRADDTVAARVITPPAPKIAPAQTGDSESAPAVEEPKKSVPQVIAEPQEAPAEPAIVFDEPSPMETPAAPPSPMPVPPPPPAPPAASMAQSAPAAEAATSTAAMESKARAQRSPARDDTATAGAAKTATATGNLAVESGRARTGNEADAADARSLDRIEVTGSRIERFGDQPLDDEPPASADSPQVQQAWLQRVRQLVAEHHIDTARDSLREYQRRYPDAPLPDDLRALLVE